MLGGPNFKPLTGILRIDGRAESSGPERWQQWPSRWRPPP